MNEQSLSNPPAESAQKDARRKRKAGGARPLESVMQLIFFICGFIAIAFVLVITIYLIISGLPAIREVVVVPAAGVSTVYANRGGIVIAF